jgi:hypothetical protein
MQARQRETGAKSAVRKVTGPLPQKLQTWCGNCISIPKQQGNNNSQH